MWRGHATRRESLKRRNDLGSRLIHCTRRWGWFPLVLLAGWSLGGCATAGRRAELAQASATTQQALAWPRDFRCPFAAVITFAGRRIEAVGTLDYHTPRDFRLTATTPDGQLLFDARYNWAGCHNLHASAAVPDSAVGGMCRDVSLALERPQLTGPLHIKDGLALASRTDQYLRHFTYYFPPGVERPEKTTVLLGTFDTLTIHYRRYNARGWPVEVVFDRPYRFYRTVITLAPVE